MPFIIGVNPFGKRKSKRRFETMGKKKAQKKSKMKPASPSPKTRWKTKTITKWRERKVPMLLKRRPRREESLSVAKIIRASAAAAFGMVVAKVAVNKLTEGGSEKIAWTWSNIFMAAGSSLVFAMAAGALFKLKKPTVALVATGGCALAVYKIFTCKLAPKWGWTESWFGADEDVISPDLMGAGNEFEVLDYTPRNVGYLPGQVGMGATNTGGRVVAFNPNMGATDTGGQVVPFDPNMGQTDYSLYSQRVEAAYR
jgi:hypothetical protein